VAEKILDKETALYKITAYLEAPLSPAPQPT
jgi:hypothetical protein